MQRLYVMNLSYQITHDELTDLFKKYGEVEKVEIPLRKGGTPMGIAYVSFQHTESAVSAYASLDKKYYQGRKLHILPS